MANMQLSQFISVHPRPWQYWIQRLLPSVELTPLRIALAYLALGLGFLYLSDVVLVAYLADPLLSRVQALKGGIEIVLTAGFVFFLTRRRERQLTQGIKKIDRQRQELEVLHRVFRHNLRNNISVIEGYVELIQERLSTDDFQSEFATILDTIEDMAKYTEQSIRIQRISDSNGRLQSIALSEKIPRLIDDHERASEAVVSANIPDHVIIEANTMFTEALNELLTNAIRHNDSARPEVSVEVLPDNGPSHVVEIRVVDNGPGIPDAEITPLENGGEDQLLHLSGMGLWFVEWTIHHSNGSLTFEENDDGGTTVSILAPKAPEMLSESLSSLTRFE